MGWFHAWAIGSSAVVNLGDQASLQQTDLESFGNMLGNGVAGLQ